MISIYGVFVKQAIQKFFKDVKEAKIIRQEDVPYDENNLGTTDGMEEATTKQEETHSTQTEEETKKEE